MPDELFVENKSESNTRPAGMLINEVHAGVGIVREGRFVFVNPHLAHMLGYGIAELLELPSAVEVVHPLDRGRVLEQVAIRQAGTPDQPYDIRAVRKDGSILDLRVCGRRIVFEDRNADVVTLTDVTEVKQALRIADWKARMLAQTETLCTSGSIEVDMNRGRFTFSTGLCALLGAPSMNRKLARIQAMQWLPEDERAVVYAAWRNAKVGRPFELQHRVRHADGSHRVVHHRGLIEPGPDGLPQHGVAILQDVTAQRDAETRIQELANYNDVSGLPNRASLLDCLGGELQAFARPGATLTLMALGIPQVDQVRASLGYAAADMLIRALAARLAKAIPSADMLAHLSAGEFAVLVRPERSADPNTLLDLSRRIEVELRLPEQVGASEVVLSHAIGVAIGPPDGTTGIELLEAARSALSDVANHAIDRIRFFSPQSSQPAIRRMAIEAALRHALQRDELELFYQPQINLRNGMMTAVEALLRWNSPELGDVAPLEFIPIAEQTGQIIAIGDWVLHRACTQAAAWQRCGMQELRVNVNVSASQLAQPDLAQRIQALLLETGADPSLLGVEITESTLISDVTNAARCLNALRALGVEIALDDFGTGYSNLNTLRSLPIDVIKIDRSYVHDVTAPPADVSVTRAVITMAHSLQMRVLAEGVETEGQVALLIANHCDAMQGFFYSPAVPAADIETLWHKRRSLPGHCVSRPPRQRTLLLVDDEESIVASLKRLLRRSGYQIVTAYSAAEGLKRLAEVDVDVIVSDQRMPGMTGVEFLRRAKKLYPDTVRIVLSGYTELQSITDAINEGAIYKFLTKPWDDDLLRANIDEAFRQKELTDENRRLDREVHAAILELADVNHRLERALASQREQVSLAESQGSGAREALFSVPVPLIGLDEDGMIAFVNADCARLMPDIALMLGCDGQESLPDVLKALLKLPDGRPLNLDLDGTAYRCECRSMRGTTGARGRLIALSPQNADAQHRSAETL